MNILSLDWSASGIGPQLVQSLQRYHSGTDAFAILKACFGLKSPATLLKRSSAFRKCSKWFEKSVVSKYFKALKAQRQNNQKGYTVLTSFLEAVRFSKFTLDMDGTDVILGSERLLGFAALEKHAMGPTRQAPGLEVEHMQRLHDILNSEANIIDKLGAGCFLICIYGRARWSEVRLVERVVIDEGDTVTFYISQHKTAAVALPRQQYTFRLLRHAKESPPTTG